MRRQVWDVVRSDVGRENIKLSLTTFYTPLDGYESHLRNTRNRRRALEGQDVCDPGIGSIDCLGQATGTVTAGSLDTDGWLP